LKLSLMRVNKSRENPPGEKERKTGDACAGFCLPYNRYVAVLEPCVWRVASVRVIEAAKAVGTLTLRLYRYFVRRCTSPELHLIYRMFREQSVLL